MKIEERIRAMRQDVETAVRESGGTVIYITISEESILVQVERAARRFFFQSGDVEHRWYNCSSQKFAATFEEAAAMRAGDEEGEE